MKKYLHLLGLILLICIVSSGVALSQSAVPVNLPATTDTEDYRLGPEDEISINTWRNKDLSFDRIVIRPNGYISFPFVGDIRVEGMTPGMLEDKLEGALTPYIKKPKVNINIIKKRLFRIYVTGQVKKPGVYDIRRPESTVSEALALSEGVTDRAALHRVIIQRETEQIKINLEDYLKNGNTAMNIPLKEGDILMVPEMNQRIAVVGEVVNPGVYNLKEGDTLFEAVSSAGWFKNHARVSNIQVFRKALGQPGNEERITINLREIENKNNKNLLRKYELKTGDIVYVPLLTGPKFEDLAKLTNSIYFLRTFFGEL